MIGDDAEEDSGDEDDTDESSPPDIFAERSITLEVVDEDELEDWPYVGFTQELIGKAAGDEGSVQHIYDEDDPNEILQNKTYKFEYSIETVQSKTLPELDDEFAKSVSNFDTLEEFRKDIREALEKNTVAQYDDEYSTQILDEIIEDSTIKYPPQMLEQEI
ncbi:MAG: hypothetical protein GWO41_05975, partial [candidate division Zixibacteria bacterium]|nr:hypothetical protein [candidate division Zixibacteria bacterium]NIR64236.1 hypothetical protein [candidate division Zixibacteria bacterium]NIS46136.1 hypothetical protein [candidate division Zixibacteria bacterium]NIT52291.1 hypothetical protein [candidate division Zixibacteria bacterium]NIU14238.1 hypothetical protein [candidate division Zixibacteria bacterium]